MISLRFRTTLSVALICFILGCCTAFLLVANCGNNNQQPATAQSKLLQAQADSVHAYYKTTIATLEKRNTQLTTELQNTKVQLDAAKAKTKVKATVLKNMITPPGYPASKLLEKATNSPEADQRGLEKCDSLVQLVTDYLVDMEVKDSLYEMQSVYQDSLLAGKEAVIAAQESQQLHQAILLKQSLFEQQLLEKQYIRLQKQVKRQRSGGRWLALGTAILSGLATHYITNR